LREVVGARNSSGIPGAKKNTPPLAMSFILWTLIQFLKIVLQFLHWSEVVSRISDDSFSILDLGWCRQTGSSSEEDGWESGSQAHQEALKE
jgi:hypothetical protein